MLATSVPRSHAPVAPACACPVSQRAPPTPARAPLRLAPLRIPAEHASAQSPPRPPRPSRLGPQSPPPFLPRASAPALSERPQLRGDAARRLLGSEAELSCEGFTEISPRFTDTPRNAATPRADTPPLSLSARRAQWQASPTAPLPPSRPPQSEPQPQPPAAGTATADATSPIAGLHVLVVDDERSHRRIACRMLERLGCTSDEIDDGENVVRALIYGPRRFGAVLLDIIMARSHGLSVVRALRDLKLDELPVVAATAFFKPEEVLLYESAGFDAVLEKPFSQRQLGAAISKAVARRRGRVAPIFANSAPLPPPPVLPALPAAQATPPSRPPPSPPPSPEAQLTPEAHAASNELPLAQHSGAAPPEALPAASTVPATPASPNSPPGSSPLRCV